MNSQCCDPVSQYLSTVFQIYAIYSCHDPSVIVAMATYYKPYFVYI